MKIKSDFVTNSSSTSFIISCKSDATDKDAFIDNYNRMLKKYIQDNEWDENFQKPPLLRSDMVKQISPGVFEIRDYVAIYGGDLDIPQYIQEFFLDEESDAYKDLASVGIIPIKTDMKDFNE